MENQGPERVFLVGATLKKRQKHKFEYSVQESLEELGRLAETAGLEVHPFLGLYVSHTQR